MSNSHMSASHSFRSRCFGTRIGILTSVFLMVLTSATARQSEADSEYSQGEKLLRNGDLISAAFSFRRALALEPANKKFKKQALEVGKKASLYAMAQGDKADTPLAALNWFRIAVTNDGTNELAKNAQEGLLSKMSTAIKKAEAEVYTGELVAASQTLTSALAFKSVFPDLLSSIERELKAAQDVQRLRQVWDAKRVEVAISPESRDFDEILTQLGTIRSQAPADSYTQRTLSDVRSQLASRLVAEASKIGDTGLDSVRRLKLLQNAASIDPSSMEISSMRDRTTSKLNDSLEKAGAALPYSLPSNQARVLREMRRQAISWGATSTSTKVDAANMGPTTTQLTIAESNDCLEPNLIAAFKTALMNAPQRPDLVVQVSSISCPQVDIPIQGSQAVSSTMVAGYNQLSNPAYAQLQVQLVSAEANLNRAYVPYEANPNFLNTLAYSLAKVSVENVRTALSSTPPYTTSPIVQPYQYQKFEAVRSATLSAILNLRSAKPPFVFERRVSVTERGREAGRFGSVAHRQYGGH